MSFRSIPDGAREDVYQLALLALNNNDLVDGLAEHYRQTSSKDWLELEPVESYRQVLSELSHSSLVDLFYEIAIQNDRYHAEARQFYIDPKCTRAYAIDALQAHLYRTSLCSFLQAVNYPVDDHAINEHLKKIDHAIVGGKNKIEAPLGELTAKISVTKLTIKIEHPYLNILNPRCETEALNTAFYQWGSRLKGIDLTYKQNEEFTL